HVPGQPVTISRRKDVQTWRAKGRRDLLRYLIEGWRAQGFDIRRARDSKLSQACFGARRCCCSVEQGTVRDVDVAEGRTHHHANLLVRVQKQANAAARHVNAV